MTESILVWGGGAIGGTIAAYWARAGIDVLLVDIESDHVTTCRNRGLEISGPVDEFVVRIPAVTPDEVLGRFSRVVLAVKAQHTRAAIEMIRPHLAADGFVVSAQNGLNELTISEVVGNGATIGAFVNFGADWHGPGQVLFGNRGAVVVGEIDGTIGGRTEEMHQLLQVFEPDAVLTDNIWGYLWGKLAYGAMLFATAINNDSMADNFAHPSRSELWVGIGREVMGLATKRGIRPVGFNGFNPMAYLPGASDLEAQASIEEMAEFNRGSAKTHSGIWRDLAVRKRKTEVTEQLGILVKLASEVEYDVPLITTIIDLIHDIEDGVRDMSDETFAVLLNRCQ
ncbi:MAG: 2-dehydropantoate 2-reductase N-terminal domain-containing protein [Arenicellales bacterium]|nr:2-dehydropantoate 2-reductase N-terminal domain-containing protein [Arenicellales bacterium]